jgi:hypothetical protein
VKPGVGLTDIFFSYSSKDRDRVEAAHKALTERGFGDALRSILLKKKGGVSFHLCLFLKNCAGR